METKVSFRLSHHKLDKSWCNHVKGRLHRFLNKRRRNWFKKYAKESMEG